VDLLNGGKGWGGNLGKCPPWLKEGRAGVDRDPRKIEKKFSPGGGECLKRQGGGYWERK